MVSTRPIANVTLGQACRSSRQISFMTAGHRAGAGGVLQGGDRSVSAVWDQDDGRF
jgi:hypothetical protein